MPSLRRSLSQNAALWLIGLIMILLAGVFAYAYSSFRREATKQLLDRDRQVAVLSASRLQTELREFASLLTALARTREMSGGELAAQRGGLQAAAPRLAVFDGGVILLDNRGVVRWTLPNRMELAEQDWSGHYAFQRVLGGAEVWASDALPEVADGLPLVSIVVPIRGEEDSFVGALVGMFTVGEMRLSAFYGEIVQLRLGQRGDPLIIDGHGRVIFAEDDSRIGGPLTAAEMPLTRDRHTATAELLLSDEGREVVAARAPVPDSSWTLATVSDWGEATRETRRYRNLLFVAFGAALLLPPLGLAAISRQRRFRFLEVRRPEQDAGWARAAQDQLHPKPLPVLPGWRLAATAAPGRRLEHEFFDSSLLPDGRLLLSIGAVSGTGLPAALTLASTRTLLRACAQQMRTLDDSLQQCNTSLCLQADLPMPVRLVCLILDPRSGWLDFACAGASPPDARGRYILQQPTVAGEPMGVNAQARIETGRIHVEEGVLLILLGPAMTEARNEDGVAFLGSPLDHVLEEETVGVHDLAEKIQRAFRAFNGRSSLFDPDLTVLILERKGRTASA